MNIFWLDTDLEKCAQYHCDKHVVKMITEYAQLLSASSRLAGLEQGYKLSHQHHPCVKWLLESKENWLLLRKLSYYLHKEYQYRYGGFHKAFGVIMSLDIPPIESSGVTMPPQCMPDKYKSDNLILAYRNYYIGDKIRFATWRRRKRPNWFPYISRI